MKSGIVSSHKKSGLYDSKGRQFGQIYYPFREKPILRLHLQKRYLHTSAVTGLFSGNSKPPTY